MEMETRMALSKSKLSCKLEAYESWERRLNTQRHGAMRRARLGRGP